MRKKAALYNPYLDVMGGGELHILSIMKVLEEEGYEITIFWDKDLREEIKNKFDLVFKTLTFQPNIFKKSGVQFRRMKTLSDFDFLFYVTDGSYFFSSARKTYVFSMIPNKSLYPMSFLNKIKMRDFQFISNSHFTASFLEKWGIHSEVLYPYINESFISSNIDLSKKQNIILSVGRFFGHSHSKNQHATISLFQKLKKTNRAFEQYTLILAGGLKEEDRSYFEELKKAQENDPSIILAPNISFDMLFQYYKKAKYFLHMTGYQIDENQHPEKLEHLGITPLEAMATGCITFCVNAGGPKEFISDGVNGYLFQSEDELFQKISHVESRKISPTQLVEKAKEVIQENFSYNAFRKRVQKIILQI